jgi:predicted secreted protein
MKSILSLLKLLLVFVLFQGVISCMQPIVIKDSGRTYNLSEDDPFQIVLPGNPTTGYTWELLPFNKEVVKQLGEPDYKVFDSKIGSGGIYTYHFQTVADGQAELYFQYKRKWDTISPASKTFEVKIVCGTMGRILED